MVEIRTEIDEKYEQIIIGFILDLNRQNVDGRKIGELLSNLFQILEWEK